MRYRIFLDDDKVEQCKKRATKSMKNISQQNDLLEYEKKVLPPSFLQTEVSKWLFTQVTDTVVKERKFVVSLSFHIKFNRIVLRVDVLQE